MGVVPKAHDRSSPHVKFSFRQLDTPIYQVSVAEWVVLQQILEIYNREMGYKRGGRRCETWWRQTAAWNQMSATLEHILAAARARRWESGRRGEVGGGREVAESDAWSDGPWYAGTEIGDTGVGK